MFNIKVIPGGNTEIEERDYQFAEIPKPGETVVLDEKRLIVCHRDLLPCKDSDPIVANIFVRDLFNQESFGLPKLAN